MNTTLQQDNKRKLIDVFIFFNEVDLLKIRLEFLGPYVDHFVISEANCDFSGKPKNFILSESFIKTLPYGHKIILHHEKINFKNPSWLFKRARYIGRKAKFLWKIQDAQRNSTLKPLKQFNEQDSIIFGDLDEFPNESSIHLLKTQHLLSESFSCTQQLFYYNLRTLAMTTIWHGSIFTTLKKFRVTLPHKIRSMRDDLPHLKDAGWHFSYFMSPEKINQKVNAIGKVEKISNYSALEASDIEKKIQAQKDIFDRDIQYRHVSSNENLIPESLQNLFKKYLPGSI